MNYLKQALTELLSGITTKKNEKEIWTKLKCGWDITVEPIDDEDYILREYYDNGKLRYEQRWKNDKLRAYKWFYFNGELCREIYYD